MDVKQKDELAFRKYDKIDNLNFQTAKHASDLFLAAEEARCCVLEKIHGSNLSVLTNGYAFRIARREDLLEEGEEDAFFCAKRTIRPLQASFKRLHTLLFPDKKPGVLIAYGELFGGTDYGEWKTQVKRPVQTEVQYHPDIHFFVFDLFVNGQPLPWSQAEPLLKEVGLPHVPTLFTGTFAECLKWSSEHLKDLTGIPRLLPDAEGKLNSLADLKDNIREGHVIKSYDKEVVDNRGQRGKRVLYKHKNDKFAERQFVAPVQQQATAKDRFAAIVREYVTLPRLHNVDSKLTPEQASNHAFRKQFFIKDVMEDFRKDNQDELRLLSKAESNAVNGQVGKVLALLSEALLKKHPVTER